MVALDPHHLYASLRIGKLADVAEELPVFLLQTPEIEVAEDVAQQDEAAKGDPLQHFQRSFRTADFRT